MEKWSVTLSEGRGVFIGGNEGRMAGGIMSKRTENTSQTVRKKGDRHGEQEDHEAGLQMQRQR